MAESIQWNALSPEERNRLVHLRVMAGQAPCHGPYKLMAPHGEQITWHCFTCGATDPAGPGNGTPETHPSRIVPDYTQSLDAAWLVVEHLNDPTNFPDRTSDYAVYAAFCDELEREVGSDLLFDLFFCDPVSGERHLTPERIAIAALRACGVQVERE
jgi:hypothetical protein